VRLSLVLRVPSTLVLIACLNLQMDSTRFYRRQFPLVDEVVMVKVSVFAPAPLPAACS
jgi:hypothetical protein